MKCINKVIWKVNRIDFINLYRSNFMCKFTEAWDVYVDTSKSTKANLNKEKSRYELHLADYWHNRKLKDIKTKDILSYRRYLTDKELSPKSVVHCMSLLRTVMNKAKHLEMYKGEIPHFDMPKFDNKRIRFLSYEEANLLLSALYTKSELWHDIALFALNTGMRAGEIFSTKAENINFSQSNITLFETKNSHTRIIPLNAISSEIAQKYTSKNNTFLFSNNKIRDVSTIYRDTVIELKLNENITERRNKVVFHTLRHTFASWLVQGGIPLVVISNLLGHKSLQMTLRYAHLANEQSKNAVDLISSNISVLGLSINNKNR